MSDELELGMFHPFNLHPDFSRVPPRPYFYRVQFEIFFRLTSAQFFLGGSLKKAGFHTCKSEKKNQVSTLQNSEHTLYESG